MSALALEGPGVKNVYHSVLENPVSAAVEFQGNNNINNSDTSLYTLN